MNLEETIERFKKLKERGISKEEILEFLEFASDVYPEKHILELAMEIVYG
jgi:hypothetical protein